jgi:hypothetical protein
MIIKTICPMCHTEITLPEPSTTIYINLFTPRHIGDLCEDCNKKLWTATIVAEYILKIISQDNEMQELSSRDWRE